MKTLKYSLIILGIIAVLGYLGYSHIVNSFNDSRNLTKVAEKINEEGNLVKDRNEIDKNDEEKLELDMTESEVQTYIHRMTHQHIIADKKWGNLESSPKNIENLLTVVLANQDAYEHSDYYIDVLEYWKKGNFNNAVSVHNTIWRWQGGTVGRATGLVDEE